MMHISLLLVNVVFVGFFLIWGFDCIVRRGKGRQGERLRPGDDDDGEGVSSVPSVCSLATVICNFAIFLLYVWFSFYECWELNRLDYYFVSFAASWGLASVVAAAYGGKRNLRGGHDWPLLLILWWVYSTILSTVSLSSSLMAHSRSSIVDVISCALSITLSSTAISSSCRCNREANELVQPLVPSGLDRDSVDFEKAGVWTRLTFRWLNPLFRIGRLQKLELKHIPLTPRSESVDFASSLLEASLWKQKTGPPSLLKAIFFAVWRSIAINGVIAGINTMASYTGPLLISYFVNLLSTKDCSSYIYGVIVALLLFCAKNVESITQRQWYFGAQRIGVRVRAGLMALIYKKTLSINNSSDLGSSGKIVNLISVDVERIGDFCWYIHGVWLLPVQVFLALAILHQNLGLVPAIAALLSTVFVMVAWQVFVLCLVILGISIWYQKYYISTARELARMVGIRKAPIAHHFSETISGAATIRCFDQQGYFLRRCLALIDDYSRVAFHNYGTMEWLCLRINILFNFLFFVVLVILVNLPSSAIDPSLAGLVATYGLNLNVLQAWVIWNLCNVENKMISVERILQFSNIESEAPLVIEDCRPSPEWPSSGHIEFVDLHVKYKPTLPVVLEGITCTFQKEKKVGIVGRTGSGKSTLIQALFRVVEPFTGRILIDGVDIGKMGLQDLRSRLSIIPQDPILFQGNVRTNLDPLQQRSDQEIWETATTVFMLFYHIPIRTLIFIWVLELAVAEHGENWSVGQRQLVCLARVLLQKRRILVLDEATASIDTATDSVIQMAIRKETERCTVLTVAHRIPTVIDNDMVLVLEKGRIMEYDQPKKLLENKSSRFSKLVDEFMRRSSNNSLLQN
ncbi:hypothetical protein SAY87_024308 [Trapa incisa]|uniref:ABC-type xenobiotic transporter n=1 Tax=Trapa incisa TaxID=236973 RepID=A0AAN7G8W8_9MYRT|nr:hypothetical protein SAY87_024308 [Trapa incisa]